MNHNDEFRSEADGLDDELAVYNDAIDLAELLEASSLGTPEALAARRAGSGVLERYRFTPPHLTADEPQASDLAQFVGEHFEAHGRSEVADLWNQAAVVEDGALPVLHVVFFLTDGVTLPLGRLRSGHARRSELAAWPCSAAPPKPSACRLLRRAAERDITSTSVRLW